MNASRLPTGIPLERWEVFLRALSKRVSTPTEAHPTVRCWKSSVLSGEIKAVVRENRPELTTTFPPAYQVIEHLKRMGWAQLIEAQSPRKGHPIEFLVLGMGVEESSPISPLELLQASLPTGTICYFSALTYHELTTQIAAHHHIARLTPPQPREELINEVELEKGRETVKRNPLGTEIFRFAEVPYYETRRDASLVPGIQMRVVSPRTWLRITTLEQTLLDTLLQPLRCGGEAVIMEAWENGLKEIDVERMDEHLSKIQREDLERRVAAILDLSGVDLTATSLGQRLQRLRERLAASAQEIPEIPLLPGLHFANLSRDWGVRIP